MSGVTKHGDSRARERMGLPRRAVQRMAAKALSHGKVPTDYPRAFRQFLEARSVHGGCTVRVYGQHIFLFGDADALITVMPISREYLCMTGARK